MIGKPCFLPCFEYMHPFLLQSFLYGFKTALWVAVLGPISIFLPLFPLRLCWDEHFRAKGWVWLEAVRMGKRPWGALGALRTWVHVALPRAPLHSQLYLGQARQLLAIECGKNFPFSFYRLSLLPTAPLLFKSLFSTISFWCAFNLNFKRQLPLPSPHPPRPNSSLYSIPKSVAVKT